MNDPQNNPGFWLGNGVMAAALIMLLFMGQLWEFMGSLAFVLWVGIAGFGAWLLMKN